MSAERLKEDYECSNFAPQDPAFRQPAQACQTMVSDGPGKLLRWGVPAGARDDGRGSASTGELVHDDRVVSAARMAALDERDGRVSGQPLVIRGRDPSAELDADGFDGSIGRRRVRFFVFIFFFFLYIYFFRFFIR